MITWRVWVGPTLSINMYLACGVPPPPRQDPLTLARETHPVSATGQLRGARAAIRGGDAATARLGGGDSLGERR